MKPGAGRDRRNSMLTTLALIAALTVTPAEETAILQQVLNQYVRDVRSHPDARQSLFISETMAAGEIDPIALQISPSTPEQVDELVASLKENNRNAIPLPKVEAAMKPRANGAYDFADYKAIVEVSRPAFTKDGKVAVVRVVFREPQREVQAYYFLRRVGETWQMASFVHGQTKP